MKLCGSRSCKLCLVIVHHQWVLRKRCRHSSDTKIVSTPATCLQPELFAVNAAPPNASQCKFFNGLLNNDGCAFFLGTPPKKTKKKKKKWFSFPLPCKTTNKKFCHFLSGNKKQTHLGPTHPISARHSHVRDPNSKQARVAQWPGCAGDSPGAHLTRNRGSAESVCRNRLGANSGWGGRVGRGGGGVVCF